MCAIIGSYSSSTLLELIELNSYRGQHSYSFSLVDRNTGNLTIVEKGLGEFNKNIVNIPGNCYGIAHIQAPTTESFDTSAVHPCTLFDKNNKVEHALWHNGILKHNTIDRLKGDSDITWDTQLLLLELLDSDWSVLNNIDGTFSCLYYNKQRLFHFRNKISPMFFDEDMNMSSTKFKDSKETPADSVLQFDLRYNELVEVYKFKTVDNPYFFGDDL